TPPTITTPQENTPQKTTATVSHAPPTIPPVAGDNSTTEDHQISTNSADLTSITTNLVSTTTISSIISKSTSTIQSISSTAAIQINNTSPAFSSSESLPNTHTTEHDLVKNTAQESVASMSD
ncbi:hypothetical protein MAR_002315, partial [Mya arenaria]